MKHPILSGSGYKLYGLIWLIIISVHGSVLYFYYDFELAIAISDSLIYNLIFSIITPGFWFIVIFGNLNKDEISLITTHISAALITTIIWTSGASYLLKAIFLGEREYIDFLANSFVWRIIIGILFYSISVLIFYLIKYYQDMQARLNRELELQNLLKDSELRMLKSQINPHFIFNSLNSVSALTVSKPENAREMVIKLSDFLRYSLGKGNEELNSLDQEINNAILYLEIEKVRFGDRLIFERDISEECLDVKVPNLILQPLFENAIKYGVHDSIEPVTIKIKCELVDTVVQIHVSNNYDATAIPTKGEGIGLENVRKRLMLIYGVNDLVKIKRSKDYFEVTLKIPTIPTSDESH